MLPKEKCRRVGIYSITDERLSTMANPPTEEPSECFSTEKKLSKCRSEGVPEEAEADQTARENPDNLSATAEKPQEEEAGFRHPTKNPEQKHELGEGQELVQRSEGEEKKSDV